MLPSFYSLCSFRKLNYSAKSQVDQPDIKQWMAFRIVSSAVFLHAVLPALLFASHNGALPSFFSPVKLVNVL